MAFYLRFEHQGADLYPALRELVREGRMPPHDRVRFAVLELLGYFVTGSSEHFAEYVPWFIKRHRPDLIERYGIPLDEYPRRCEAQIAEWEAMRTALEAADPWCGRRRLGGQQSSGVCRSSGWHGMRSGCVGGGRRHERGGRCTRASMRR